MYFHVFSVIEGLSSCGSVLELVEKIVSLPRFGAILDPSWNNVRSGILDVMPAAKPRPLTTDGVLTDEQIVFAAMLRRISFSSQKSPWPFVKYQSKRLCSLIFFAFKLIFNVYVIVFLTIDIALDNLLRS